jgi:SAM-dependent methyltransferase
MTVKETYTAGYSDTAVRYMMRRHATRDAAFLLPHLKKGMSLLDCGCGPGNLSIELAQIVAPGSVTGVDIAESQIELARRLARERRALHVRFETASVYELPFPGNTFDAFFSHALFEHLADPAAALREITRVLKPGAVAGICSPEWAGNIVTPEDPEAVAALEAFQRLQRRNGGNPNIGRDLGRLMHGAGFTRIAMTALYDCYDDVPLVADLLGELIEAAPGPAAPSAGTPPAAEVARLSKALRRWARQPGVFFAQSFVAVIGYTGT